MHEVLPRKSVVRLTDRPDMTLGDYRGRKTTMQQQQQQLNLCLTNNAPSNKMLTVKIYKFGLLNNYRSCRKNTKG